MGQSPKSDRQNQYEDTNELKYSSNEDEIKAATELQKEQRPQKTGETIYTNAIQEICEISSYQEEQSEDTDIGDIQKKPNVKDPIQEDAEMRLRFFFNFPFMAIFAFLTFFGAFIELIFGYSTVKNSEYFKKLGSAEGSLAKMFSITGNVLEVIGKWSLSIGKDLKEFSYVLLKIWLNYWSQQNDKNGLISLILQVDQAFVHLMGNRKQHID